MPKIILNIISIPLLLEHGFERNGKEKSCSFFHSSNFYANAYTDNGLLILSLNDHIFYVDENKKKERCECHISLY